MFFNFTFRHFLTNPHRLATNLKQSAMQGLWQRIMLVFVASFILFSLRSLWGMNTENFTVLLTSSTADYTLARFSSLLGSMIWSAIYVAFHLFGIAYILSFMIGISFRQLLPMQVLMTALLLLEKVIIFGVFYSTGTAVNLSFLSLGPLASTYLELPFFVFFFNQLTITTVIIIVFQFQFIRTYGDIQRKHRLLMMLIGLHLLMAIFTASIGLLPIEDLFNKIVEGGAGIE